MNASAIFVLVQKAAASKVDPLVKIKVSNDKRSATYIGFKSEAVADAYIHFNNLENVCRAAKLSEISAGDNSSGEFDILIFESELDIEAAYKDWASWKPETHIKRYSI